MYWLRLLAVVSEYLSKIGNFRINKAYSQKKPWPKLKAIAILGVTIADLPNHLNHFLPNAFARCFKADHVPQQLQATGNSTVFAEAS